MKPETKIRFGKTKSLNENSKDSKLALRNKKITEYSKIKMGSSEGPLEPGNNFRLLQEKLRKSEEDNSPQKFSLKGKLGLDNVRMSQTRSNVLHTRNSKRRFIQKTRKRNPTKLNFQRKQTNDIYPEQLTQGMDKQIHDHFLKESIMKRRMNGVCWSENNNEAKKYFTPHPIRKVRRLPSISYTTKSNKKELKNKTQILQEGSGVSNSSKYKTIHNLKKVKMSSSKKLRENFENYSGSLSTVFNLLLKIFQMECIPNLDLNLSRGEKYIFTKIFQQKKINLYSEINFNNNKEIRNFSRMTAIKRPEERLKFIFKLSLKHLRTNFAEAEHYRISKGIDKTINEIGFWRFYFESFCNKKGISIDQIFQYSQGEPKQNCSLKVENLERQISRSCTKSPINKNLLAKLKENDKFFGALEDYLFMGCSGLEVFKNYKKTRSLINKNIINDNNFNIRSKMSDKFRIWDRIYKSYKHDFPVFKQQIDKEFTQEKYKLPWSTIDLLYSLDQFKKAIEGD